MTFTKLIIAILFYTTVITAGSPIDYLAEDGIYYDTVSTDTTTRDLYETTAFVSIEFLSQNSLYSRMNFIELPYVSRSERWIASSSIGSLTLGGTFDEVDSTLHISLNLPASFLMALPAAPFMLFPVDALNTIGFVIAGIAIAPHALTNPTVRFVVSPYRFELFAAQRTDFYGEGINDRQEFYVHTETKLGCSLLLKKIGISAYGAYSYIETGFTPHGFHGGVHLNFLYAGIGKEKSGLH